jgi:HEAT repeat protein
MREERPQVATGGDPIHREPPPTARDVAPAAPTDPRLPAPGDDPAPATTTRRPETARRRAAAVAGHEGDAATARRLLTDPDPGVRATALGALERCGALAPGDVRAATADPAAGVRRRAAEVLGTGGAALDEVPLAPLLADDDPTVVEVAAWAAGERLGAAVEEGRPRPEPDLVEVLAGLATGHADALCREAAVAALGAIGDEAGLPAILVATTDKATVRRRAVLALAPFEGPEVDEALQRAVGDRDWQVRQAAEDLLADD